MKKLIVITTLLLSIFTFKTENVSGKTDQIDTIQLGNSTITINESEIRDVVEELRSSLKDSGIASEVAENAFIWESIIAIVIPITFFITSALIVFLVFYYRRKERDARYQLIEKAMEKGEKIPDQIFITEKKEKKTSFDYFKNGIICFVIGAAQLVMWLILGGGRWENFFWSASGLILFFLGAGYVLIAIIEKQREKKKESSNE